MFFYDYYNGKQVLLQANRNVFCFWKENTKFYVGNNFSSFASNEINFMVRKIDEY